MTGRVTPDFGPYRVHPVLAAFPLMEGEEFAELAKSIDAVGLQEKVVLAPDGETIVDGRNRYLACVGPAQCAPTFRTLGSFYDDADIVRFIVNANVRRRHLTEDQLAPILALIEGGEEPVTESWTPETWTQEELGDGAKSGKSYVALADRLLDEGAVSPIGETTA